MYTCEAKFSESDNFLCELLCLLALSHVTVFSVYCVSSVGC